MLNLKKQKKKLCDWMTNQVNGLKFNNRNAQFMYLGNY